MHELEIKLNAEIKMLKDEENKIKKYNRSFKKIKGQISSFLWRETQNHNIP